MLVIYSTYKDVGLTVMYNVSFKVGFIQVFYSLLHIWEIHVQGLDSEVFFKCMSHVSGVRNSIII